MDSESRSESNEPAKVEKYTKKLSFVMLPPILRKIGGGIPDWALQEGYNPDENEQMAIFGDKNILVSFINDYGLEIDKHPIHDAKMGVHIDIFTSALVEKFKGLYPLISTRDYWQKRQEK